MFSGVGSSNRCSFVRSMLGESGFAAFLGRARAVFGERFADPVNDFREVLFATGTKP